MSIVFTMYRLRLYLMTLWMVIPTLSEICMTGMARDVPDW